MHDRSNDEVILIKIGGSSITDKGRFETVNNDALLWLVQSVKRAIADKSEANKRYVIVHGAGSFGHHTAKEYGLKGITSFPPQSTRIVSDDTSTNKCPNAIGESETERRRKLLGLGRTRISVQKLNHLIVTAFLDQDVPVVGISPCFSIVQETSVNSNNTLFSPEQQQDSLRSIVESTIDAGLIPVLHGDGGLFREYTNTGITIGPAILSGDTIMQMIGTAKYVTDVIFITDVDGVYTSDPNNDPFAKLIPKLFVDTLTSSLKFEPTSATFQATNSSHEHDVTGGLKTKLAAAIAIAATGKHVTIVRSGTSHAEHAILHTAETTTHVSDDTKIRRSTVLLPVYEVKGYNRSRRLLRTTPEYLEYHFNNVG